MDINVGMEREEEGEGREAKVIWGKDDSCEWKEASH